MHQFNNIDLSKTDATLEPNAQRSYLVQDHLHLAANRRGRATHHRETVGRRRSAGEEESDLRRETWQRSLQNGVDCSS